MPSVSFFFPSFNNAFNCLFVVRRVHKCILFFNYLVFLGGDADTDWRDRSFIPHRKASDEPSPMCLQHTGTSQRDVKWTSLLEHLYDIVIIVT
jgi:hypothetical protein